MQEYNIFFKQTVCGLLHKIIQLLQVIVKPCHLIEKEFSTWHSALLYKQCVLQCMCALFCSKEEKKNSRDFFSSFIGSKVKKKNKEEKKTLLRNIFYLLQFFFCEYSVLLLLQLNRKQQESIFIRKPCTLFTG